MASSRRLQRRENEIPVAGPGTGRSVPSGAGFFPGTHQLLDVDEIGGVVAGITGVAVFVAFVGYGSFQCFDRQISERIGFNEAADLIRGGVGGDELAFVWRIDTVEAGRDGGR